jgi:hypothetical protein
VALSNLIAKGGGGADRFRIKIQKLEKEDGDMRRKRRGNGWRISR